MKMMGEVTWLPVEGGERRGCQFLCLVLKVVSRRSVEFIESSTGQKIRQTQKQTLDIPGPGPTLVRKVSERLS
jgi:hypothetical protein